jgi:hypothetical protein
MQHNMYTKLCRPLFPAVMAVALSTSTSFATLLLPPVGLPHHSVHFSGQTTNTRTLPTGWLSDSLKAQFDHLDTELPVLADLLAQCQKRSLSTDYELVNYTTIKNFIVWGREALAHGDTAHADSIAVVLNQLSHETTTQLQAYLRGDTYPFAVPRYVTQRPTISGASFLGDMRWPDGHIEHNRPLFFMGYGHFLQVRKDIPQFTAFGTNIIQIEIGPSSVIFPPTQPGRLFDDSTTQITGDIQHVLDSAAKYNIAVNLLLSPHNFPAWALKQWPDMRDTSGDGFIQFNIVAPRAKAIMESYLRTLIPMIKDAPALHSVTLTNEPRYDAKGDSADQQAWHAYLTHLYGTIQHCNTIYGTQYPNFTQIPIPTAVTPTPVYYDWMTFKNARFAAWHQWMASIIHDIAPALPVHIKTLTWTVDDLTASIDPERFAAFSDINGNDNWISTPNPVRFLKYERFYDLLGSLKQVPIFDSEAHLHPGTAAEVRTGLWQGAIHGRNAATLWVWDTPISNPPADHPLLTRPDVIAAVGRTSLDLNRLAREVTALQTTPAVVAILYTLPSHLYTPAYMLALARAYRAVTLTGQKADFITEQQITAGKLTHYKLLLIPAATHTQASTVHGIRHFADTGGHIIAIGSDLLTRDEHNQPLPADDRKHALATAIPIPTLDTTTTDTTLQTILIHQFQTFGITHIQLIDAATNHLPDGVEWRATWDTTNHRWLINVANFTQHPKRLYLELDGQKLTNATDLITATPTPGNTYLIQPYTPYLFSSPHP